MQRWCWPLTGLLAGWLALSALALDDVAQMRRSVVRISVTVANLDYREPWQEGTIGGGVGTGFVIAGNRLMTNAHVISNVRQIQVQREGDPRSYNATVLFVAHDCDLGLLAVEDERFFQGMVPLAFGDLPAIQTTVSAYGYPIGGQRLSVTRGVVSRVEFRQYSHSGLDAHLAIQIDAAINPGNSGGPVMQDGKVVGVAFQGFTGNVAQNIGYMIPTPVVQRFLTDIKDGRYDGYVELAVSHLNLVNPSYRERLGLPDDGVGVVVTRVLPQGSADGVLQAGDVLQAIDGHPILSNGEIELDGDVTQLEEIVERKFHGDQVVFDFLREGKPQRGTVTLKGAWPFRMFARHYDERPQYVMFAGLLFQPLTRDLMEAYGVADLEVSYYYGQFVTDELYQQRREIVVFSNLLPDEVNSSLRHFVMSVVDKVNGKPVGSLAELAKLLDEPAELYVIDLVGRGRPIVLEAALVREAQARIQERYDVRQERYLGHD